MADAKAEAKKHPGGRPPGRRNNRTLALGAQIDRLIPTDRVLRMFRKALSVGLKPRATTEEIAVGLDAAKIVARWKGTEALAKQPLPPPTQHIVEFTFEGLPAAPAARPGAKAKGSRR